MPISTGDSSPDALLRRAGDLNVDNLLRQGHRASTRRTIGVLGITALSLFLFALTGVVIAAGLLLALITVSALTVWLWRRPVRGIYVLFGASVLLAEYVSPGVPDALTSTFPFFEDVNTIAHSKILALSPADLFIVLVLGIWLLKGIAERRLHFDRGSLMGPLGLYLFMVLVGEVHGLTSGGDFRISMQEIRGQVYVLMAYFITCNLVKRRSQVRILLSIFLIGTGVRGVEGAYRYIFTVRANHSSVNALFPHEQAFFFNGFLILTVILFLYDGLHRTKRVALLFLPFVLISTMGNNRRAAIAALAVTIPVLFLVTVLVDPQRRRAAAIVLVVLGVVFPPYYVTFSNRSGTIAMPARALASNTSAADARDQESNQYRVNEGKDILATMKLSPIIGYGYGKPMITPYTLANIGDIYVFWNYQPHNSILWVWMRLGMIGFFLLWLLIGTALMQASHLLRRLRDPELLGLALFIVLMVMQEIVLGYLDLQWTNYRNLIVVGVLFALISRLPVFAADEIGGAGTAALAGSPAFVSARGKTRHESDRVTRVTGTQLTASLPILSAVRRRDGMRAHSDQSGKF